jgi:hypothetical protein
MSESLKQKGILVLSLFLVPVTIFFMFSHFMAKRNNLVTFEPGYQYGGLIPKLAGVKKIGFLTNKDVSPENGSEDFLQAQYILAPRILDLNNSNHEYNIFDYPESVYIFYMLKKLNAERITDNEYRKVLVRRKSK